jgi:Cu(I)/Ag(I) efflux system membrane protein CusA/SilA
MKREKLMNTMGDLKEAIIDGAVKRIRPKVMTASVIIAGLIPIMWSSGTGSDVMKRIAAPMVGGVVTSVIMELLVYPVIYEFLKQKGLDRSEARTGNNSPNKEA